MTYFPTDSLCCLDNLKTLTFLADNVGLSCTLTDNYNLETVKLPVHVYVDTGSFTNCPNLILDYAGTVEEWSALGESDENFAYGYQGLYVQCSNGQYRKYYDLYVESQTEGNICIGKYHSGMTWAEFCNSEYNYNNMVSIRDDIVYYGEELMCNGWPGDIIVNIVSCRASERIDEYQTVLMVIPDHHGMWKTYVPALYGYINYELDMYPEEFVESSYNVAGFYFYNNYLCITLDGIDYVAYYEGWDYYIKRNGGVLLCEIYEIQLVDFADVPFL
jgi:hypothetical protein